MKTNSTNLLMTLCILGAAVLLTSCADGTETPEISGTAATTPTNTHEAGEGRTISGSEALELYGVAASPTPGLPTATPQIWFPARAWVEPSILPYDPDESIEFLPMFSNTRLDGSTSLWLGDLEAGKEVILHGVTEDGAVCIVEGETIQGWSTKGFVACNRLRFTEPNE